MLKKKVYQKKTLITFMPGSVDDINFFKPLETLGFLSKHYLWKKCLSLKKEEKSRWFNFWNRLDKFEEKN